MKLVIFGVAALLIGIGGSTGVLVMTAPKLPPGADSLIAAAHADTTHHAGAAVGEGAHTAPAEGAHGAEPPTDAALAHEAAASEATPSEAAAEPSPATHGADAATASHSAANDPVRVPAALARPGALAEPDAETYKQVGSILMNMKPADAAKVMAYLTDPQIEGLLRSMSPRNAATVLSQMPPERAAALSRRLLVPVKEDRP